MAIFFNQATITVNGTTTASNIAYGEIVDVLSVSKTVVEASYTVGDTVTYVVVLRNTGTTALTGLTVNDDLGGYPFGTETVYPLAYVDGSALLYVDGVLQPSPVAAGGPPLAIGGIQVPAGGEAVLVYQATVTTFADPSVGGTIVTTVNIDGAGTAATAVESVTVAAAPSLAIVKSINPAQVSDNERVTYTFLIQNFGNTDVDATDDAVINDTFDPILTDLIVTFNGTVWTEGTQYTYDETTGVFSTVAGQITVPAATYTQDPQTGAYTQTPGTAVLTVVGTI